MEMGQQTEGAIWRHVNVKLICITVPMAEKLNFIVSVTNGCLRRSSTTTENCGLNIRTHLGL